MALSKLIEENKRGCPASGCPLAGTSWFFCAAWVSVNLVSKKTL